MIFGSKKRDLFRTCSTCKFDWKERDDFLSDGNVSLVGYQFVPSDLASGLFLFNHGCGTTLSLVLSDLLDLYKGAIHKERLTGTPQCDGHCLDAADLEHCTAPCEAAFAREIMQTVRHWPKTG